MTKTRLSLATLCLWWLPFTVSAGAYVSGGVTEINYDGNKVPAATTTVGYSYPVNDFMHADVSYTTSIGSGTKFEFENSEAEIIEYKTYNLGIKLEYDTHYLIVNGRTGFSYTNTERTLFTGSTQTSSVTDKNFRPYASIGGEIPAPAMEELSMRADIVYQQLTSSIHTINVLLGGELKF